HRREHHFGHDRKDEGFDETQAAQIPDRARMAGPDEYPRVKRTEQPHQPIPPSSGTKLTAASSSWVKSPLPSPRMRIKVWLLGEPTGATSTPVGLNWSSTACGIASPAAVRMIASNGASSGQPSLPSSW